MWNSWMRWFFLWNPTFHAKQTSPNFDVWNHKLTGFPCSFPSFPSPSIHVWWVSQHFLNRTASPSADALRALAAWATYATRVFLRGLQGVALHGNKNVTRWVDLGQFLLETTGKMGKIDAFFYGFKVEFHGSGMEHQTVKMSITRWNEYGSSW